MKWRGIVYLYRVRLRRRRLQELLALVGIAVGVALLFASQVSSASLTGSVQQLENGIVGHARFQLMARGPNGFDARLLGRVERLPGVQTAVPVLEAPAGVIGPAGEQAVELIGTEPRLARLGGTLLRRFTAAQLATQHGIALPSPIARAVGAGALQTVKLRIDGSLLTALVGAELNENEIGALAHSPVAVAPLAYAQQLTGRTGRISRIFVLPRPGANDQVQRGLERLAAAHLNVEPADFEATLFRAAARPTTESTQLFAALSALVGFLFAFNAVLLTVPRRRAQVADLRLDGYRPATVVKVLLFDALALGVAASLVGLALGELLSIRLFHVSPSYLSFAFPVGSQRIVTWQSVAIALAGGMLAAAAGVLAPLRREIFADRPTAAAGRRRMPGLRGRWLLTGGITLLALTTAIVIFAPQLAVIGVVSLTATMLLLLPGLLTVILAGVERLSLDLRASAPFIAVKELRSPTARARTLAVAATGAVAVFGSVSIQGAHANLLRGLYRVAREVSAVSDLWVTSPGVSNLFTTVPFRAPDVATLAHLPGVRTVHIYRAGLLDYGKRRIWVLAPPRAASGLVPEGQVVTGNSTLAAARVRAGGWAVVSQTIAVEEGLHVGQTFTLPAPKPTIFRVAALSTNIGWSPGAIVINADEYARAWGSTEANAYNVMLTSGASPTQVRREIRHVVGPPGGLTVETSAQLNGRKDVAIRQGLVQLTQISDLVLVGAILAMAAAMGSMLWQRRARVAQLKLDGLSDGAVWRALLLETAILLAAGCSIGAVFGIYGQIAMTRALVAITAYPVVYSLGLLAALASFAIVAAVAVAIVAIPGYLTARVHPVVASR
jgi:putative ABC transport system permease protein